jgi:hypothetical protein
MYKSLSAIVSGLATGALIPVIGSGKPIPIFALAALIGVAVYFGYIAFFSKTKKS